MGCLFSARGGTRLLQDFTRVLLVRGTPSTLSQQTLAWFAPFLPSTVRPSDLLLSL